MPGPNAPDLCVDISSKQQFVDLPKVLHFAFSLQYLARKAGGNGRIFRGANLVRTYLSGVDEVDLSDYISVLGTHFTNDQIDYDILAVKVAPTMHMDGILPGEYLLEKLTKKLLVELPCGAIIVSTLRTGAKCKSAWVARITASMDRQRLWHQALARGVARHPANVVWSQEDSEVFQLPHSLVSPPR